MIENKKGLSAIVTTLLVILLVLVAVGIVWGVVNQVIKSGASGVEIGAKCLNTNIQATAVTCAVESSAEICDVTLERTGTNDEAISGVKLVFRDSTNTDNSAVIDSADLTVAVTNIEKLVGDTAVGVATTLAAPDSVEVTVYFEDASGNEQLCSQTTEFNFVNAEP